MSCFRCFRQARFYVARGAKYGARSADGSPIGGPPPPEAVACTARRAVFKRNHPEWIFIYLGNYIPFYTESNRQMYLHGRRSCRSRQSRVCKFDPTPTASEGECNRACSDCRAATAEAELVPQIRLGGGFCRNPQGYTVLDYRRCNFVYNSLYLLKKRRRSLCSRETRPVFGQGRSSGSFLPHAFPSAVGQWPKSVRRMLELTATGIAPDLHRRSLLIPCRRPPAGNLVRKQK